MIYNTLYAMLNINGGIALKQKEFSVWIRAIIILGAICVVFLGVIVAPDIGTDLGFQNPGLSTFYWPCLVFIWITAIPVFIFLCLVWQIASEIGEDNSFCNANARRLRGCSILAIIDTILYMCGGIALYILHVLHPGIFVLILGLAAIGLAITVCCAALSHLTHKAADMQSENNMTI